MGRQILDMCGQTDTKILDMCGQTDTKILPTEKVETGLKKEEEEEEEEERKKKSRNIMSPTFIGLGDIKRIHVEKMCITQFPI